MENNELLRRAEDLCSRAERSGTVTHSGFLTPAERVQVEAWARQQGSGCRPVFFGGRPECERQAVFFLPEYLEPEDLDTGETICAMHLTAAFGSPGHRDYMGAILGMGVGREWVGDIWVKDQEAWVFCMKSVLRHLLRGCPPTGSPRRGGRCRRRASRCRGCGWTPWWGGCSISPGPRRRGRLLPAMSA